MLRAYNMPISLLFFFGTSCSVQHCLFTAVPLQRDSFAQQDLNLSLLCWLSLFEPRTVAGIPLQCSQQKYLVSWLLWQINRVLSSDRMCVWSTLFFEFPLNLEFHSLSGFSCQVQCREQLQLLSLKNGFRMKLKQNLWRFWRWYSLKFVCSHVYGNWATCACLGSKCNKTQW